ncbi:ornithine decarboxylase antizyme-domain-containing protein [Lasiosphaeris hirsuta]|uniref:Ornithine decarboxylase antizyme n=1 Tax=Lasiosphaeris hirsuta TaxID=260670 RepID=A0AA40E1S1_9PEZI|nr:ornithine decarboxylase antizyme-domain-containing protein [Lasiosphaeris hirsuta]
MAPMKQNNNYSSSSHYGEDVARQANILASCYLGPSGIPEVPSTGLPSPPSSPPLAAITTTNQLALTPKAKKSSPRSIVNTNGRDNRRGGATLRIREECERFFCETLCAMFLGERNSAPQHSRLMGVYNSNNNINRGGHGRLGFDGARARGPASASGAANGSLPPTPPDDYPIGDSAWMASRGIGHPGMGGVNAWLEIWDYAGASSFRAFVAEDPLGEDKSLFVFFDAHVLGRDLKQALVALIELADGPLDCGHMVICIDRSIPGDDSLALTRGLQWAGFSLTTLDFWSSGYDVVSNRWLFMGMEL